MPAVGKTTLAIRIAHMLSKNYPDAKLFLDCYGYTPGHKPLNNNDILDSLLFALGIATTLIPQKYSDKLSLWRTELNKISAIIVLDNINNLNQVDDIISINSKSLFILTSRNKLTIDDCIPVDVDILDTESAVILLNEGKAEQDRNRYLLLKQLAGKYGYLPLALQILSHQIKGRSNKYIERLITDENRINNLDSLTNAIELSFNNSYEELKADEKELFCVLGLFPGFDFTPATCAAMLGLDTNEVYHRIDVLYRHNLIKEISNERYNLHDLMKDFSISKYKENRGNYKDPIIRLIHFYIKVISFCNNIVFPHNYLEEIESEYYFKIDDLPTTRKEAFDWLHCELENILACLSFALKNNWEVLYFQLSYVLSNYLFKSISGWRNLEIYKKACEFSNLCPWMHAASITNLAQSYYHVSQFEKAESIFSEAEKLWNDIGYNNALVYTLGIHAFTFERLGKYPEALALIEHALKIGNQIQNLSIIASILNSKGAVYWRMKKYPQAKKIFESAISIRRKIRDEDGESKSLNNHAFTLLCLGDEIGARNGFEASLELSHKYQDYTGEAITLNNLGYTEIFSHNPDKAIEYANMAHYKAKYIGDEYQIARSNDVKGKAFLQKNDYENTRKHLNLALTIFLRLKVPEAEETKSILDSFIVL